MRAGPRDAGLGPSPLLQIQHPHVVAPAGMRQQGLRIQPGTCNLASGLGFMAELGFLQAGALGFAVRCGGCAKAAGRPQNPGENSSWATPRPFQPPRGSQGSLSATLTTDLHLSGSKGAPKNDHFVFNDTGGVSCHGRGAVGGHDAVPPGKRGRNTWPTEGKHWMKGQTKNPKGLQSPQEHVMEENHRENLQISK